MSRRLDLVILNNKCQGLLNAPSHERERKTEVHEHIKTININANINHDFAQSHTYDARKKSTINIKSMFSLSVCCININIERLDAPPPPRCPLA